MKKILVFLFFVGWVLQGAVGQVTFQKAYGGGGASYNEGLFCQQTNDSGYIFTGRSNYYSVSGHYAVYLLKTNSTGDTLWAKSFYNDSLDSEGNQVQQTLDGGYAIVGNIRPGTIGDICFLKTDSSGNLLWAKTFGGSNEDDGNSFCQTNDGGFIITGSTNSFGFGGSDVYLIKTDSNGDTLWTKVLGGIGNDVGNFVEQTNDSGFIVVGYSSSFGSSTYDVYLIKLDVNGVLQWSKTFGGSAFDWAASVKQTDDSGYVIVGTTESFGAGYDDVYLIRTDAGGNLQWSKTIGGVGEDQGSSIALTMNGDFVITGYAKGQPISSAGSKVYIISVNGSGNLNWTKTIGSTFLEDGFSIQQTSDRGFIIGGYQEDWGPGWDGFYLIKTDSLGNSGCNELNSDTTVTSPATVASDVITLVTSGGNVGMPVWHINTGTMVANICSSVGIAENRISYFINIYPNPTTSTFTISLPNQSSLLNSQLKIYDVTGRVVHEQIITQKSEIINQHLAPGVYFVKVEEGEKNFTQKLIVE